MANEEKVGYQLPLNENGNCVVTLVETSPTCPKQYDIYVGIDEEAVRIGRFYLRNGYLGVDYEGDPCFTQNFSEVISKTWGGTNEANAGYDSVAYQKEWLTALLSEAQHRGDLPSDFSGRITVNKIKDTDVRYYHDEESDEFYIEKFNIKGKPDLNISNTEFKQIQSHQDTIRDDSGNVTVTPEYGEKYLTHEAVAIRNSQVLPMQDSTYERYASQIEGFAEDGLSMTIPDFCKALADKSYEETQHLMETYQNKYTQAEDPYQKFDIAMRIGLVAKERETRVQVSPFEEMLSDDKAYSFEEAQNNRNLWLFSDSESSKDYRKQKHNAFQEKFEAVEMMNKAFNNLSEADAMKKVEELKKAVLETSRDAKEPSQDEPLSQALPKYKEKLVDIYINQLSCDFSDKFQERFNSQQQNHGQATAVTVADLARASTLTPNDIMNALNNAGTPSNGQSFKRSK